MKRFVFVILAIIMVMAMALPCAATEEATEIVTEEVVIDDVYIDIGEVHEIVENSSSFAEAVIAIADRFGISVEDAEGLVNDMKALGDKYLGGTELWEIIKNDMAVNPGKYVCIALVILIFVAIVVVLLRWMVSNAGQLRTLKITVAKLRKSVDGDDTEEGEAFSLRSLITAKNNEIKALEEKDAALEAEVIKLREQAEKLTKSANEVKKNTESALHITQETALQIAQLLYIAMSKGKMPIVSEEAKQIWYDHMQTKIKAAAGIQEGGEPDASEEVQTV